MHNQLEAKQPHFYLLTYHQTKAVNNTFSFSSRYGVLLQRCAPHYEVNHICGASVRLSSPLRLSESSVRRDRKTRNIRFAANLAPAVTGVCESSKSRGSCRHASA
eukprot:54507-Eustigmatos_ZCMA.PRE.1